MPIHKSPWGTHIVSNPEMRIFSKDQGNQRIARPASESGNKKSRRLVRLWRIDPPEADRHSLSRRSFSEDGRFRKKAIYGWKLIIRCDGPEPFPCLLDVLPSGVGLADTKTQDEFSLQFGVG